MSHRDDRLRFSIDPHGYQPLVVDEDCLSDVERREVIVDAVARPYDWKRHMTRQEWGKLEKELAEIRRQREIERRNTPSFVCAVGSSGPSDIELEFVRRGSYRTFARDKYAGGQRIWYGDGVPWAPRG
jgi:hypothetical protein